MPRSMVVVCNKLPPHCYLRSYCLKHFSLHKDAHFSIHIRGPLPPFFLKILSALCLLRFYSVLMLSPGFPLLRSPFQHTAPAFLVYPGFSSARWGWRENYHLMLQNMSPLYSPQNICSCPLSAHSLWGKHVEQIYSKRLTPLWQPGEFWLSLQLPGVTWYKFVLPSSAPLSTQVGHRSQEDP